MHRFELQLPRQAISPRGVARPAEVWRLAQEVAVSASTLLSWPPEQYMARGCGFIVRQMRVRHHSEVEYGDVVEAETWLRRFRRASFIDRQIVLRCGPPGGPTRLLAEVEQLWVFVRQEGAGLAPGRCPPDLEAPLAAAVEDRKLEVDWPESDPQSGARRHRLDFMCWHSWLDPLGHVNHPTYLEWCEEAIARRLRAAGVDPQQLRPVGDELRYKRGVVGGEAVEVEIRLVGAREGVARIEVEVHSQGGLCVTGTLLRTLGPTAPPERLIEALR